MRLCGRWYQLCRAITVSPFTNLNALLRGKPMMSVLWMIRCVFVDHPSLILITTDVLLQVRLLNVHVTQLLVKIPVLCVLKGATHALAAQGSRGICDLLFHELEILLWWSPTTSNDCRLCATASTHAQQEFIWVWAAYFIQLNGHDLSLLLVQVRRFRGSQSCNNFSCINIAIKEWHVPGHCILAF